uniref:Transcription factor IIIA n=2 Tax=Selaginella moellendorffii TaxID=88036 RepID=B6DCI8_SELML|nr:transcription factor IIIA [Selaginella moellendorffii]
MDTSSSDSDQSDSSYGSEDWESTRYESEDVETGSASASSSDQEEKKYECRECGKKLGKPSLLRQHLLCHSNERKFCCPVDSCGAKYKWENHLKRHINDKHDGKVHACSRPGCIFTTRILHDLKRHTKLHEKKGTLQRHRDKGLEEAKEHACKEEKCGKAFRYPSQLRYHEETCHGEIYVDIVCSEPGCNERFDHPSDLAEHTRNAHKYVFCEVCGKQCMRSKIKRHYATHDKAGLLNRERIKCPYPDCPLTYLQENNLRKHIKVAHLKFRPYPCSNPECGKSFAYRHVRDNHEKSVHLPVRETPPHSSRKSLISASV